MLRIRIETQQGQLQMQIKEPAIDLSVRRAEIQLDPENSQLQMRSTEGQLDIDQSQCWYAHGIKTAGQFTEDIARASQQKALAAIAEISSDGERMSHIENKQNMIAQLAKEALDSPQKQLTLRAKPRPKMDYRPGKLAISFTKPSVNARFLPGDVALTLNRGDVRGEVNPRPDVRIWTVESKGSLDIQT
ncbi:DUF6470 family protein [Acetonema longum]|uniref:Uncharacterized protein n=1 Tax=Acetonema longum DSM 6540 TaxID=1009370 RepID=F7NNU6_9FIRM|nr:DUF6470 family protein [Acetonema longum]EGO62280.1 hypothetical protein ALO_18937 [Acetonema longum DSM 6540]